MRVLHICSNYANRLYHQLVEALTKQGVDQRVYMCAPRGAARAPIGRSEVDYAECFPQYARVAFLLKEKAIREDFSRRYDPDSFDVIHAHTLFTDGCLALWSKCAFGTPYVVAVRNTDLNAFLRVRPWLRGLGRDVLREASQVVFLSSSYEKHVVNRFVLSDEREDMFSKSHVIPNGISEVFLANRPQFGADSGVAGPCRAGGSPIRLIQVGDINRNKNQLGVLRAKRLMEGRGQKVEYKVIGKVKNEGVLRQLRREPGIEVHEFVPQEELIDLYRAADVFVMPSKHETFGLTYIEAMSQGLPVVYTAGQGIDGYFPEGSVGYGAKYGDVADLADKVLGCYQQRERISRQAVEEASAFCWEHIAERYLALYARALDSR